MGVQQFIYRHRFAGQRAVALAARVLPLAASRRVRALADRMAFNLTPGHSGETLPPIFHYWSHKHLQPLGRMLRVDSPEMFYLSQIRQAARTDGGAVRVLSLGTGICSMEIQLAMRLRAEGIDARFTCADINPRQVRAGSDLARDCGISTSMHFMTLDCELPFELPPQDVIIVNQFFHRVHDLGALCRSLRASLAPDGVLASSDIIGRNGHMLWPDVAAVVDAAWNDLPDEKRMDHHFGRVQTRYQPIDHAAYCNQSVHAQDVVERLLETFDFELFFTFGGAIMPFLERRVGFNFDPQDADDRAFIDALHSRDACALGRGDYPASNMIATLRHKAQAKEPRHVPVTPQQHNALVQAQIAKIGAAQASRQRHTA